MSKGTIIQEPLLAPEDFKLLTLSTSTFMGTSTFPPLPRPLFCGGQWGQHGQPLDQHRVTHGMRGTARGLPVGRRFWGGPHQPEPEPVCLDLSLGSPEVSMVVLGGDSPRKLVRIPRTWRSHGSLEMLRHPRHARKHPPGAGTCPRWG